MARFRFRLQPVLSYKERLTDAAQLELARAQERRLAAERKLAEALVRREAQAEALRALLEPGEALDLSTVEQGQRHLELLDQRVATCRDELVTCRREEAEQRERAVAALREQKSLERLREYQAGRERAEAERGEAKLHDESALQRYTRQRRQPDDAGAPPAGP